jgi:aspartyl-tRNA(Asn)/glutamyl-tRNA(Gln) amidotransferase subunit A
MVPRADGFPAILHDFEVAGPIARCVEDIITTMTVIAGADWRQSMEAGLLAPLRILYIPTFSNAPVDPGIATCVAEVAVALERQGHHVEHVTGFDLAAPISEVWPVITQTGIAWLMSRHGSANRKIGPALADMVANGQRYAATDYLNALDVVKRVERDFDDLFADFDILLTPATAAMPWPAAQSHPDTIAGQPVGPRGHAVFTPCANALGLPAISLPCRSWLQDMPVGFQLVGRRREDAVLLALSQSYERQVAPPLRWPPLDV